MKLPKVTFGFVNCNRLEYVKSCIESTLECTSDYPNREFILVDNASIETGTQEYLEEKKNQGFKVFKTKERDPHNEYARALNTIIENTTGEYVVPLAGDTQCVAKRWLEDFVKFFEKVEEIAGCICLNAQRTPTVVSHEYVRLQFDQNFLIDLNRPPMPGAADVLFKTSRVLDLMYPWEIDNSNHEYSDDSETKMLKKVQDRLLEQDLKLVHFVPIVPVYMTIYTDPRGTNARVRENKRYGRYSPPMESHKYYEYYDYLSRKGLDHKFQTLTMEEVAVPIGWKRFVDKNGIWKKNPIRPETATEDDYVEIS